MRRDVTPERLRAIENLFHAARERPHAERERILAAACADDPSLKREVESLLEAVGNRTAVDEFASWDSRLRAHFGPLLNTNLLVGAQFGPYRIDRLVGAGGMGQVYAATDSRLHRTVAIKLLLPDWSADAAFRARFEREAQLIASLNHPGIAAIYGLETVNGIQALVLEFVDGPTLADHLARVQRVPVREALGIARQIASALEAAHERGIVHRDLKPSNIKITPAGTIKLLDFGIAQVAESAVEPGTAPDRTDPNLILGTAAYMSPEQARGDSFDKRSDVWAFGCVLYEMLAGKGAFAGDTVSDSIAKVIERDPDWTALAPDVPASIRRLLRRCLQKNPTDRLHDVADARIEIAEVLSASDRDGDIIPRSSVRSRAVLATVPVAVLVAAAVVWWVRGSDRQSTSITPVAEFGITFPNNFMPASGIALSPDGRRIAANVWSNSGNIWIHTFDGSQPKPLAGGEQGVYPFWSPDSATLGFFQSGHIVTMAPTGGPVTQVARVPDADEAAGATWNRDNVIVFSNGTRLFRVPASGGSPPVAIALSGVSGKLRSPTFLPDGRHLVFCAETGVVGSLKVASLDGGDVTHLGETECPGGTFAPPNHVLFLRGGSVFAQTFDPRRLALAGEPQVVAVGVNRGAAGPWPALTVSASDTGAIAIPAQRGGSSPGVLTWFNRQGQITGTIPPGNLAAENLNAQISPTDDSLVAVNRLDAQASAWHIWVIETRRNNAATRLTADSANDVDPVWSPDGRDILYTSERNGTRAFYRQSIRGGSAERLLDVSAVAYPIPSEWSPDGYVLFQQLQRSIWAFRPGEHDVTQLLEREAYAYGAHLSPDGRWLAYAAARDGRFEVFVERFRRGSPRRQISTGGGVHPHWTKGGTELVYWAPPGGIVANEMRLSDTDISAGPTHTLVGQPVLTLIDARAHFDVSRDGQKILVRQPAGPPSPGIRVIVNWTSRLN